jgi:hypothetical protein
MDNYWFYKPIQLTNKAQLVGPFNIFNKFKNVDQHF